MLFVAIILITLNTTMVSCKKESATKEASLEETDGLLAPGAEVEGLAFTPVPTISQEAVIASPVPSPTPISQALSQVPMPVLLWEAQVPAIPDSKDGYASLMASPAGVFMEIVSFTKFDYLGSYLIIAFDKKTGNQEWGKKGSYQNPPWGEGPPIIKTADSGIIFIGRQAFDSQTGLLKWEVPDAIPFEGGWTSFPHERIEVIQAAKDYVYLSDNKNGNLLAVDLETGEMKWAKSRDDQEEGVNYVNFVLVEDTIYGADTYGSKSIDALDRFNGEFKWRYETNTRFRYVNFFPLTANEKGAFGLRSFSPLTLFHLNRLGQLQWEKEIEVEIDVNFSPTQANAYLQPVQGTLILTVTTSDSRQPLSIYGLSQDTGEILWSSRENPWVQMPLFFSQIGNSLIAYSLSQDSQAINILDLSTDKVLGNYPLPGPAESLARSDGLLYVLIKTEETSLILALEIPG
jgi:outer membrane protein assembly factor BamB